MLNTFSSENFHDLCERLILIDKDLKAIIQAVGYPPMWSRPNSFESLIHIILEQQVSLASARSAMNKLQARIGAVTPENLLALSDEEMKACYFSRQKTGYARHLAEAILSKQFEMEKMQDQPDEHVREALLKLKGIGNWTADIYLMFTLQRADIFPVGDLAAVNALKSVKQLPKEISREALLIIAAAWRPHRTVATMILWHWYLSGKLV